MDLDSVFQEFINWQTGLICLSIYILTFFSRSAVENIWTSIKSKLYWTEVILPIIPITYGIILGLIPVSFPWPGELGKYTFARVMYCAGAGQFSAWVFQRIMSFLNAAAAKVSPTPPAVPLTDPADSTKSDSIK